MDGICQDLRYALRALWKQPGFTLVAAFTLALGIGANTAIFSVVNALVLTKPSIVEPDRVTAIWRTPKDKIAENYTSYLEVKDWQTRNHSFEVIAGYKPMGMVLTTNGKSERVWGLRVTSNFLSLLKVHPTAGRDFEPDEERRDAAHTVLLGHSFWQNRFGGDAQIIGHEIFLDGTWATIIGILPQDFEFPLAARQTDLITTVAAEGGNLGERGANVLFAVGRLKPGVKLTQAQAETSSLAENMAREFPQYDRDLTVRLVPAGEEIVGSAVRRALWALLGTVGFILLIACTNVTNLLLVRATARGKEFALRAALGAGRWVISRQLLIESLLLSLLAAAMGLALSAWGVGAIKYYGRNQLPRLAEAHIDGRVLAFTLGASVVTALLFSLLPVLRASKTDINDALKEGAKSTGSSSLGFWRDSLVVAEVALGLILLIGAGLMVRSLDKLLNVKPGFDPKNVLVAKVNMTREVYQRHDERLQYVTQTLERLKAMPGVQSAAFAAPMPFSGANVGSDFRIEGEREPEPGKEPVANNRSVTPQYFQALGIPLIKGRYFTDQDRRGEIGAAIINQTLARLYFGERDPIGARISHIGANQNEGDPGTWEIVGIVGDVHHSTLTKAAGPELFLPYQQNSWNWGNFFVRASEDPSSLAKVFTDEIQAADGTILVTNVQPLTQAIDATTAQAQFYTLLFSAFGLAGLVLTLSGIYSVISYTVSQRFREMGIRVALGAESVDVLKLIVGKGMLLTVCGTVIGIVAASALARFMAALLFDVNPLDLPTFLMIAALLPAAALPACWIPARRATRVDPTIALRTD